MYCIKQVSMCGQGGQTVWAQVKHLNFFFGGGSNFRPLGLENSSNVIKYPKGTRDMHLCPYQPLPPLPPS